MLHDTVAIQAFVERGSTCSTFFEFYELERVEKDSTLAEESRGDINLFSTPQ